MDGCRAACRGGGRNVTQHIDLSFVGRVTESMMGTHRPTRTELEGLEERTDREWNTR